MNSQTFHRVSGSLALKALPAIYGVALIVWVIRILPLAEFGRYGMAMAWVNVVAALSRGLWMVPLVVHAARGERGQYQSAALWLTIATATVGAIGALYILPAVGIGLPLTFLVIALQFVLVPRDVANALLQSEQRAWATFTVEAGYFIGSLLGFTILALAGKLTTAETVLAVNVGAALISALLALGFERQALDFHFRGNWRATIRFGRWVGMLTFGEMVLQQGDSLLVGAIVGAEKLAPYLAARTLMRMYGLLSQAVNFLVLPHAAALAAAGQISKLVRQLKKAGQWMLALLIPANVAVLLFGSTIIPGILGDKYIPAVPILFILLIATFCEPVYSVLTNALAGIGKPWVPIPVLAVSVAFYLIACVVGVKLLGIGAAPWILVITYVILAIGSFIQGKRYLADKPSVA